MQHKLLVFQHVAQRGFEQQPNLGDEGDRKVYKGEIEEYAIINYRMKLEKP